MDIYQKIIHKKRSHMKKIFLTVIILGVAGMAYVILKSYHKVEHLELDETEKAIAS